ncbi:hypothetical protein Gpo141_00002131 [Globisporangium polare]
MTTSSERSSTSAAALQAARNESLACLLSSSQIRRRRSRAVQILVAIASVLLCAELLVYLARECVQDEWRSWLLELVFPSHDVTGAKVLCLTCGFALTFYHLIWADRLDWSSRKSRTPAKTTTTDGVTRSPRSSPRGKAYSSPDISQSYRPASLPPSLSEARNPAPTASQEIPRGPVPLQHAVEHELPQVKLVNEYQSPGISSSDSFPGQVVHVNGKEPIAFENDFFQGHLLFLVRDSTLSSKKQATKSNWNHLFNGRKRALWIQVQGRFKRLPPPDATLFLAVEVASRLMLGFWTRKLVEVLVSIMKKLAKHVHVSFGDDLSSDNDQDDEAELPHAAFPLYQTVDEFVETPILSEEIPSSSATSTRLPPMLGIENFGESQQQKERRMRPSGIEEKKEFALDRVYSFQFYTMYADLAQWQIANVPGMPEIPLKKLTGDQPIRFSAYTVTPPPASGSGVDSGATGGVPTVAETAPRHTRAAKDYLFCFSLQYNEANRRSSGGTCSAANSGTGTLDRSTLLCSPTASSLRSSLQQQPSVLIPATQASVPDESNGDDANSAAAQPVPARVATPLLSPKLQQHERALRNLKFALPMWIEQVDRVAGNRKVSYLFMVEETITAPDSHAQYHRYSVVRSAATIKNALLMLRDDEDDDASPSPTKEASGAKPAKKQRNRSHEDEFRKLLVESREFLYETITSETEALECALHKVANDSGSPSPSSSKPTRLEKLKRAMLSHCLKSSGTLPSARAFQDIGVQLSKAKRERMDIIWECGVYRAHTPRLLRQEWLLLTTSDVHFFRSYSMRACKSVAITELLRVQSVDAPHVLNPQAVTAGGGDEDTGTSGSCAWHCVELHLVCEIVTLFLESEDAKKQFVASLNQMLRLIAKPGHLPPLRAFESQALPLCLNQRNMLPSLGALGFISDGPSSPRYVGAQSPLALVQDMLHKGLAIYEMPPAERKSSDLLPFLDAVELLSDMELPHDDDDVLVSGLHGPRPQHGIAPNAAATVAVLPFTHEEKLAFALNLYHVLYIHATLVFGVPGSHFQWKKLQSVPFYVIGRRHHHQCQKPVRLTLEVIEHEMLRAGASTLSPETSGRKLLLLGSGKSSSSLSSGGDSAVPRQLAMTRSDFRTAFALQMNCRPGTHIIRVYDGSERIHEQLNATCSLFLEHELRVDLLERVIWLPCVIAWRQQDFLPRSGKSVAMSGGSGDPRAFYCLQKLLGFLEETQRDQVENVLLGAGKSARIVYDTFWTERSSSSSSSGSGAGGLLKRSVSGAERASASPSGSTSSRSKSDADVPAPSSSASGNGTGTGNVLQFLQSFF